MDLSQQVHIPVSQQIVWESLNDPEILKQCLPGCELFERVDEQSFDIALTAKVGPVKAKFKGDVHLTDVVEPASYTISGSGKGGVAGFAKGSAHVNLTPATDGQGTLMTYSVHATVGGKLAQIGSRLVTGAARKMADEFFAGFVRLVTGDENLEVQLETLESTET